MSASRRAIVVSLLTAVFVFGPRLSERFVAQGTIVATTTPWVEPDFPFFSSVIDARKAGPNFPTNNLTPRGLVVRVGSDTWAAFDVDLLRVSAIWRGKGVTPLALAPGSYNHPDRKTPGGQSQLPEPDGAVWLANGIYPGWQIGPQVIFNDPREPAPSPEEVGRGPVPDTLGRFNAIRQVSNGVVLEYTIAGALVQEYMQEAHTRDAWTFAREFHVAASQQPMWLVLGTTSSDVSVTAQGVGVSVQRMSLAQGDGNVSVWAVRVPAHGQSMSFVATFTHGVDAAVITPRMPVQSSPRRWAQEVTTNASFEVEGGVCRGRRRAASR